MKLYEATEALGIIDELLEESEGELTPEIEELLDQAEGAFDEKCVRVALKIRELRGSAQVAADTADRIALEAERCKARSKVQQKSADNLLKYMDREMEKAGRTKPIKHDLVTIQYDKMPDVLDVHPHLNLEALAKANWPYVKVEVKFSLDKRGLMSDMKVLDTPPQLPEGIALRTGRKVLRVK